MSTPRPPSLQRYPLVPRTLPRHFRTGRSAAPGARCLRWPLQPWVLPAVHRAAAGKALAEAVDQGTAWERPGGHRGTVNQEQKEDLQDSAEDGREDRRHRGQEQGKARRHCRGAAVCVPSTLLKDCSQCAHLVLA